jgi:hypothetical protein
MAWKVAIVAGLVVVVVVAVAIMTLMPRSSGDGWRLDRNATWDTNLPGGLAGGLDPTVVVYGRDETSIGIGVTAFGSSSCPPELRGVQIDDSAVEVSIADAVVFGGCTADAAPHRFGIVVERNRLPDPPFEVVIHHGDRSSTTEIETLP